MAVRVDSAIRMPPSEDETPHVLEVCGQMAHEARGLCSIDHAVVVGETEGEHESRSKGFSVPNRHDLRAHRSEDGNLGRIDDRRECRSAYATER